MPWSNEKSGGLEYRDVWILQYKVDREKGWRTPHYYARRAGDFTNLKARLKRDMLSFGHKKVFFKITKRKKVYWHGIKLPTNAEWVYRR